MDSDYSDLTDISGEEEYDSKLKPKKGSAKAVAGYKIRNALKVPRATTYTAQALYDQIHNSDIDLEPEYQRAVVWPEHKQIGIIDSIFRNFYIPPVIFAVNASDEGVETRTCIDGKQRLTSIHRFMDGLIPHKDPYTGEKLWYKDVPSGKGSKRKLLPDKYRKLFANKQIVCVEYQDITDSDEREIFQRVQLGMALTPAEKLQVINTSRASFVRELQRSYIDSDQGGFTGDGIEWERSRGSDFRCLAQALFCVDRYPSQKSNIGTMPQLEKWLDIEDDLSDGLKRKVRDTYRIFRDLVRDPRLGRVFKKSKIAPVEFICISLLIAVWKDKMTMSQLSATIGKMRENVRTAHVDIRMNTRVAKTMLDFIGSAKLEGGKSGEPVASATGSSGQGSGGKSKRKRDFNDDDDDDDDDEGVDDDEDYVDFKSKPKSKKSSTTASASSRGTVSHSSSSTAATDRMAAVRAAKQATSRQQPPRPPPPPEVPPQLTQPYAQPQLPRPPSQPQLQPPAQAPLSRPPSSHIPSQHTNQTFRMLPGNSLQPGHNLPSSQPSFTQQSSTSLAQGLEASIMASMMTGTQLPNNPQFDMRQQQHLMQQPQQSLSSYPPQGYTDQPMPSGQLPNCGGDRIYKNHPSSPGMPQISHPQGYGPADSGWGGYK